MTDPVAPPENGSEPAETWYEVQVDRETLVLLALGLVVLLVAAFFVGRWTAPGEREAGAALAELSDDEELGEPVDEIEPVDGDPLFGASPVSVEGAPPIGEVPPAAREPAPTPERATAASSGEEGKGTVSGQASGAEATRPPARPAEPASRQGWVVQVAAVRDAEDAQRLRDRLAQAGWDVFVVRESGLSKVQVGPFPRRSEAEAAERRLKREEKLSTWVKRS